MARDGSVRNVNNFTKGFITEVSAVNFPDNSAFNIDNLDINVDGSVQRRLGADFETSFIRSSTIGIAEFRDKIVSRHRWASVANNGDTIFQVFQIGETLFFHDLTGSSAATSVNVKSFSVDLTAFIKPAAASVGSLAIDTTSGNGKLYVSSNEIEAFSITYDPVADTISTALIDFQIRDLTGINDALGIDERPSTLSAEHRYNLLNQGWDEVKYTDYFTAKNVYPSNADIWSAAKDADEEFDPDLLDKLDFGSTPAPKGRFLLSPFTKDRTDASGVGGLPSDSTDARASAVEFFSSRLFYTFGSTVLFSQIIQDVSQEGRCYQEADPSSEFISDLIDTDGGVIPIPEAGDIKGLLATKDSLLIFSNNGVWQIAGVDRKFSATGFQLNKVTSVGIENARNITEIEGNVMFFADAGIYNLSADQVTGLLSPGNITEKTIQSFYLEINSVARRNGEAVYDPAAKKIYFFYNDDSSFDGTTFKQRYTACLIFDFRLQAFYKYSFAALASADSPFIYGAFVTPTVRTSVESSTVIDSSGDTVIDASLDTVVVDQNIDLSSATSLQLLSIVSGASTGIYTISEFKETSFVDWLTEDSTGASYSSFLEAGFDLMGDLMRDKRSTFIFTYFNKTETSFIENPLDSAAVVFDRPSGCFVQAKWDWTLTDTANRWSPLQQVYRFNRPFTVGNAGSTFDYSFSVIEAKTKFRGKGKTLQVRFESEDNKDFQLIGWALPITSTTTP